MTIHPMPYGTFQVRINGRMLVECLTRRECEEFVADPVRFGYGLIGGPK
jgi:hypothetical protein